MQIVARHPHKRDKALVTIIVVTHALWRLFLNCTSDFGKIERISATIARVGDPVFATAIRIFKHGSGVEKSWKLQVAEQWQDSVAGVTLSRS